MPKKKPRAFHISMLNGNWGNLQVSDAKLLLQNMWLRLEVSRKPIGVVKHVEKHPFQGIQARGTGKNTQPVILAGSEPAQVIKSHDMVSMRVGDQYAIKRCDPLAEALLA